ncbi:MAG: hypothetical protein JSU66_16340 [Deltaproteobacteria bacterium]|nr:MAG: hypothetical protein JSU66_16340 [Deltaproteobacteria bacterium]
MDPARSRSPAGRRDAWRRSRLLALTLVLAGLYLLVALAGPRAVGLWVDDSIYLCTAKSLAAGTGYRHIEMPGEPLQTLYPILYPAVLASVFLIAPEYPANLPLLLLPTALAAAGFVMLSALYCRRYLATSARQTLALGALVAVSPAILSMVRFTMSEFLYALLAIGALHAIERGAAEPEGSRRGVGWMLLSALLVAASIHTRSIGLTLAAGSLGFLLWRRRLRDAALAIAVLAVCLAPWYAWQAWAAQLNASTHGALLLPSSEFSYRAWAPDQIGETLRVVLQNSFRTAFGLLYFQLGLPVEAARASLAAWSWRTACLHLAAYAGVALVLIGFVQSARRRLRALHVCAAVYAALVLAYPFDPYRFLVPWTPFLLYFLLCGARASGSLLQRWIRRGAADRRIAALPAAALFALLAALFALEAQRILRSSDAAYYFRVAPMNFAELRALEAKLPALAAPQDAIASTWFAALYLATGRQGYFVWPLTDPHAHFYAPDREWWNFFLTGSPSEQKRLEREVEASLVDAYRSAGIAWYVDHAGTERMLPVIRGFVSRHLDWFEPRYETPGRTFRVHRVRLPPRGAEGAGGAAAPAVGAAVQTSPTG